MANAPPPAGNTNDYSRQPPVNPAFAPDRPPPYQTPRQPQQYPAAQPYYQGGYPLQPGYQVEQPFIDPMRGYPPQEVIVIEEPYPPNFQQIPLWDRGARQPSNVVYVERDNPYRRNYDDMDDFADCCLFACCASLLCCCLFDR